MSSGQDGVVTHVSRKYFSGASCGQLCSVARTVNQIDKGPCLGGADVL